MKTENIGEEKRHNKRLAHREAVKSKSRQLLEKVFPNPVQIPSETAFISSWEKYSDSLLDTYGQQRDFRLAFNHGVSLVKKYQKVHGWTLSPPSHLITNKTPTQLRSPEWLKGAWALYDAYDIWLKEKSDRDKRDVRFRYQSLILSLLMDSGQCNIDVVRSFNHQLQQDKKLNLKSFANRTFVTLKLENENLNSNAYEAGEPVTTFQCYLSVRTLGQLRLWQKLNKKEWQFPQDSKQILQALLAGFPEQKHLPTSLKQFCSCGAFWYERNANLRLSQALLEYRVGRTRSYSLPISNLVRLISPVIHPVQATSFSDFSTDVKVKHSRKLETQSKPISLKQSQFTSELKRACKPTENGEKVTEDTVRGRLEGLLEQYQMEPWQQVFIQWLIYKTHGCVAKTVHQYMLNQVKYWYLMNTESHLSELTASADIEGIYQEQIDKHLTKKSQSYFAKRLKELHGFAAPVLGLPSLSDSFFHIDAGKKHTRAGLIDEPLFKKLLQHIEKLMDLNDIDKLALQSICILAYRCGLRLNELYKLQLKNLESSKTGWLEIRPNRFGDNKTASGLRKVPVFSMLFEHECDIVADYLRLKRGQNLSKTSPLLTMGENTHRPFNTFAVSNYVGKVLRALSGEDHLVFYHLRHSCFSRLQLMLESYNPKELLPEFYPYSEKQTADLRQKLFKKTYSNGYWEIAALGGHESPQVTFMHYFHLSDLLATPSGEQDTPVSLKGAQESGLCSRRYYQSLKKDKEDITYGDFFELLADELNIENLETESEKITAEEIILQRPDKEKVSISICYQVLEAISRGERIDLLAYQYRLKQETIDKWLHNALYLKSLMASNSGSKVKYDKSGNKLDIAPLSRQFSARREHALVPGKLKTIREIEYTEKFVQQLRVHYKERSEVISDMMQYCLKHTVVSKSGVNFNSPSTLKQFIDTFQFAIPKSHWRAVKLYINTSSIKEEWQALLKGMATIEGKRGKKTGRSGTGSVRLELISPSEEKYTEGDRVNKYSSHLVVYLMFMSFVLLQNQDLLPTSS
ncbi:hypothetical protein DI392_11260 [Vibrio albus]|uniref:Tyr recombinase domain-containing protein n=1 Tax=Vibrio albus TaxID=2200953 RepID=A0A2U3B9D2_9VIBR|nr:tyrosine-type recombinase/integrase [Vibrio albus]PWI33419.1 hypothetical protein DI392_11260 [Vibrio albus]